MQGLEAKIESLNVDLADPDLYAKDVDLFTSKSDALVAAQMKLGDLEEEWLELEELREAAES